MSLMITFSVFQYQSHTQIHSEWTRWRGRGYQTVIVMICTEYVIKGGVTADTMIKQLHFKLKGHHEHWGYVVYAFRIQQEILIDSDLLDFFEMDRLIVLCQILLMFLLVIHIAIVRVGVTVFGAKRISAFARKLSRQSHLFLTPWHPTTILLLLDLFLLFDDVGAFWIGGIGVIRILFRFRVIRWCIWSCWLLI